MLGTGESVTGEEKGEREVHLDQEAHGLPESLGQPVPDRADHLAPGPDAPPTDTPYYHPSFSLAAIRMEAKP